MHCWAGHLSPPALLPMARAMGEFGVALTVTAVTVLLALTGLAGRLAELLVHAVGVLA
jgi:hypothetical protein